VFSLTHLPLVYDQLSCVKLYAVGLNSFNLTIQIGLADAALREKDTAPILAI
jgi:hypothetical protein